MKQKFQEFFNIIIIHSVLVPIDDLRRVERREAVKLTTAKVYICASETR
jgi:hypothetical protein